jgi:thioredoxin-dependent peroxiredoxin
MTLRIGDTAPDFTVNTTQGEISLHDWAGNSWVFFFSHPADFTPICTTEMGMTAKHAADFSARNTKPLGLSTDSVDEHLKWMSDVDDTQGVNVNFPIIADKDLSVANAYDMIHPEASDTATVRSVFIIDPNKKIRLTMTYPMNVGRNFDEILRVIDALQIADKETVALPANWRPGDKVIIPLSLDDDAARAKFGDFDAARPYLRMTSI